MNVENSVLINLGKLSKDEEAEEVVEASVRASLSHQCSDLKSCTMGTEKCHQRTKYGINLQSKLTRKDNIEIKDQMDLYRKWEQA